MKRKHSIIIEVTFEQAVRQKDAVYAVRKILTEADKPKILGNFRTDVERIEVKHADNVARGIEQRCARAIATELGVVG